jgi:hypothetical protein
MRRIGLFVLIVTKLATAETGLGANPGRPRRRERSVEIPGLARAAPLLCIVVHQPPRRRRTRAPDQSGTRPARSRLDPDDRGSLRSSISPRRRRRRAGRGRESLPDGLGRAAEPPPSTPRHRGAPLHGNARRRCSFKLLTLSSRHSVRAMGVAYEVRARAARIRYLSE